MLTGQPAWLATSDQSIPEVGIVCQRIPDALKEENTLSMARYFRVLLRLIDEIGPFP